MAAIRNQLLQPSVCLLTLTGSPGVGKTRLALEVTASLREEFENAVLVELAPIRDPGLVCYMITRTLGARQARNESALECLKRFLSHRHLLLVLDNFEQVVAAAPNLAELLAACSKLKVLVTSRQALRLRWEHEFQVPPLGLPDPRPLPPLERLSEYPAIALFLDRARAVRPDFGLSNLNARAVAEICASLDGLPLAIELAAARCRGLTPKDIVLRLRRRLDLLNTGLRDHPVRQQSLRAAIGWSYDLLDHDEQALFRRLGIFAGGCTVEAVEAVGNSPGNTPINIVERLGTLVDKGLLRHWDRPNGTSRFMMLETIREYAIEQLESSGEIERTRHQHADYFLSLAQQAKDAVRSPLEGAALDQLETEHDNLRAALDFYAASAGAAGRGLRLAQALGWFWSARGHYAHGREYLARALKLAGTAAPPALRAGALLVAGELGQAQGDYAGASSLLEQGLAIFREIGDKRGTAQALNQLGGPTFERGDFKASQDLFEQALVAAREVNDKKLIGVSLANLGISLLFTGRFAEARALLEEALAVRRQLGDKGGIAICLCYLGEAASCQDDYAAAYAMFQESLAMSRKLGHRRREALVLGHLGSNSMLCGDFQAARSFLEESLRIKIEIGHKPLIVNSVQCFASLAARQGQAERAARLFGAAESLREMIGLRQSPNERADHEHAMALVRAELSEEALTSALSEGRAMGMDKAIGYALAGQELQPGPAALKASPPRAGKHGLLTAREREVASLVARGLTNREIAKALVTTERTAANHIQHIMNKLGLHSRTQIALWWTGQAEGRIPG